jgi:phosphoribosylformylglycinamidine cyclo-ligase
MDYRSAGVDVAAGREFVNRIRGLVERTHRPEVVGGLGGFSGLFQLPEGYQQPLLVAGTDGVGTKLQVAQQLDRHDTVGIDLVAMCVNDVLTCGAEPLFFLDYIATAHLELHQLVQVVSGITSGCQQAGCALLGGETAEMPGFYKPHEYDLAGFCVGIVEKSQVIDGSRIQIGDIALGLPSSGVHSNGYSLVRKIMQDHQLQWSDRPSELQGEALGACFLTPTQIYVKPILTARKQGLEIRGMAHITGGGLPENLPRCLSSGQSIAIDPASWSIPPIFEWLAQTGEVKLSEMFNTFNMGVGFVVVVPPEAVEGAIAFFNRHNLAAWQLGQVIAGDQTIEGLR